MASILRLEDQRVLREAAPPAPPPAPPPAAVRGKKPAASSPPPPPLRPISIRLLVRRGGAHPPPRRARDRPRRRWPKGRSRSSALLADTDPEVRQMAAFALGLIGDKSAREPLVARAGRSVAARAGQRGGGAGAHRRCRGRRRGRAHGRARSCNRGALAQPPADEDDVRRDTPSAAARLGIYALVRLKAYPQLASAVLDGSGQPRVRWWPVAYALQRLEDTRALPALLTLAKDQNPYTRAFAVKGLGALKDASALPVLMPLLSSGDRSVLDRDRPRAGPDWRSIGGRAAAAPRQRRRPPIRTSGSRRSARSAACDVPAVGRHAARPAVRSQPGDPRRGAALGRDARSGELHRGAVGARSGSALERPRRAGDHPRHAARSTRRCRGSSRCSPTPISASSRSCSRRS